MKQKIVFETGYWPSGKVKIKHRGKKDEDFFPSQTTDQHTAVFQMLVRITCSPVQSAHATSKECSLDGTPSQRREHADRQINTGGQEL